MPSGRRKEEPPEPRAVGRKRCSTPPATPSTPARRRVVRADPDEALQLWRGLVDGTWSLVDHHDTDGKRYLLARRNQPGVREPTALTQNERSVLAFAAMGHQNKYIA